MESIEPSLLSTDIAGASANTDPFKSDNSDNSNECFPDLLISDVSVLNSITERTFCASCNSSRRYFCYTCHVALPITRPLIPLIETLPSKIDVIKHEAEIDGKSTAIHAKVISPDNVDILHYPSGIPDYENDAILVFPDAEFNVEDVSRSLSKAVFIDGTWSQAKKMLKHPKLRNLKRVKLKSRPTTFWRPQTGKSEAHLATIEAVYYFVREFHESLNCGDYDGRFDNLLFLYKFFRDKIPQ